MKLYNTNTDIVGNIKTIKVSDTESYEASRISEEKRNSLGYYDIVIESQPNRRYYNAVAETGLVGNKYVTSYTKTPKDLNTVKTAMVKDLDETEIYKRANAKVITVNGIEVNGTREDLDSFERGSKRGVLTIRDANRMKHTLTKPQIDQIAEDIETNGMLLFETAGNKFDEIHAFTTIEECELYEATPYNYTITAEDVLNDIDGSLVEGAIQIRHKNNVKEW